MKITTPSPSLNKEGNLTTWQDMHDLQYSDNYHCEHFAIDCYRFLTKQDVSELMLTGGHFRALNLRNFVKLDNPIQNCFVLMRDKNSSHVGIWYNNQVLHLTQKGVVMQPLFTLEKNYKKIRFYKVNSDVLNQKTN